ncbi:MAG TPA: hypothetical protein VF540_10200 [Segetibacter sp.]|jgi:hypothetical protein
MDTAIIREELHHYLEVADDEKLKAIYVILEAAIKDVKLEYSDDYKKELDQRVEYYLNGGKMVTGNEMNSRLRNLREKGNKA